jgi:hypothetical protein
MFCRQVSASKWCFTRRNIPFTRHPYISAYPIQFRRSRRVHRWKWVSTDRSKAAAPLAYYKHALVRSSNNSCSRNPAFKLNGSICQPACRRRYRPCLKRKKQENVPRKLRLHQELPYLSCQVLPLLCSNESGYSKLHLSFTSANAMPLHFEGLQSWFSTTLVWIY